MEERSGLEDEQNTLWLSWRDDQFIAQVGFLSTMNALAYFSKSPFFDGIPDQQSMLTSHKTKRLYVFSSKESWTFGYLVV